MLLLRMQQMRRRRLPRLTQIMMLKLRSKLRSSTKMHATLLLRRTYQMRSLKVSRTFLTISRRITR